MSRDTGAVSAMNLRSPTALLASGHALQRQGRLAEAAAIFREVLSLEPGNGHALHLLGVTVGQMGRPEEAAGLICAAVEAEPDNPAMHTNLGHALSEIGRRTQAI